jgi:uncharacterized protein RhaS with RHS repeats
MTSDGTGVGAHTYRWDAEGRLTSVGGTGCSAASYTYNALGQRVEKLVGSTYTEIVYGAFGQTQRLRREPVVHWGVVRGLGGGGLCGRSWRCGGGQGIGVRD